MKPHAEETEERSADPALDWVMQIAQSEPIDFTSKDVFLQIQSDSADVRELEPLTEQAPDNWIRGLQTDLHMVGTSLSVIPAARLEAAKAMIRLEIVEKRMLTKVVEKQVPLFLRIDPGER